MLLSAVHLSFISFNYRVIFAIAMSAGSVGFASAYFPEYAKAKLAAGIIFKMLDEKSEIDNFSEDGGKPVSVKIALQFKSAFLRL